MTPRQKLDALINLFTPEIRNAFLAAISDVVDNAILRQVIAAIEIGDAEAAFAALGFSPAAMRPISAALERAFEQGGVMTGATFPKYLATPIGKAVFRFDVRNSRAEKWLRDHSSELITRIENETRSNVRNVLTEGMKAGRNPRSVALDIVGRVDPTGKRTGGIVGLSSQQEFWVRSARTKLETLDKNYFSMELRDKRFDNIVRRAIDAGKPLPSETVDKLITRYKANALKYRGDMIGRTEAIHSLNRSEWEATKQAVESGAVSASAVVRIWDSAGDSRVRWSHMRLDGQRVGLDEAFRSPSSGAMMMFPGDTSHGAPGGEVINCRCRVRTEIDWLADLGDDTPAPVTKAPPRKKPAPPVVEPSPADDLAALVARNDEAMKQSVVANGKKHRVEFLIAQNAATGEVFKGVKGKRSQAPLSIEMMQALGKPENQIILHHNHPNSSSFSPADLSIISKYPGAKGIWAHGHDGSSYYAERGEVQGTRAYFDNVLKTVQTRMQNLITFKEISFDDASLVWSDVFSMILAQKKMIKYQPSLSKKRAEALARIAPHVEQLLKEFEQ